jgi:biopolymer transport protein ExbD
MAGSEFQRKKGILNYKITPDIVTPLGDGGFGGLKSTMGLRRNKLRESHDEVDTGPLNDILFILLMFFLMISTLANPNVIKMSVPRAKSDTKTKQSVVVSVGKDRGMYVGSNKIEIDSLESALRKYINEGDSIKPPVVINADSSANWGEVVRVMKVARKLGATTSATVSGNE